MPLTLTLTLTLSSLSRSSSSRYPVFSLLSFPRLAKKYKGDSVPSFLVPRNMHKLTKSQSGEIGERERDGGREGLLLLLFLLLEAVTRLGV